MFSIQHLGLVLIGGGIGSICRYVATTLIGSIGGTVFPFGTLFVNLLGSFLMGFLMFFFLDEHFTLPETLRLFLAVGFLGGFTTFSSFSMESLLLLRGDSFFYAFANLAGNMLLGLLAVWLGMQAAGRLA
jgi:CrcB protein